MEEVEEVKIVIDSLSPEVIESIVDVITDNSVLVDIASTNHFICTVWIPGILFFVIAWVCLRHFWGRG